MEILTVIISATALIISLFVAWQTFVSPFSLIIHSGNPRIEYFPQKLKDGGQVIRFTAILPLQLVNKGARDGLVKDIVIIVHSDSFDWMFYPAFYCDYSISNESTLGNTLTKNNTNIPFYPIHLNGKETLYKSILFVPDGQNERFPLGNGKIVSGKYHFSVCTLKRNKFDYEEKLSFDITFNDEQIRDMNTPNRIGTIPFVDELKNARHKLKPKNVPQI
jgi:hypothetical protein